MWGACFILGRLQFHFGRTVDRVAIRVTFNDVATKVFKAIAHSITRDGVTQEAAASALQVATLVVSTCTARSNHR